MKLQLEAIELAKYDRERNCDEEAVDNLDGNSDNLGHQTDVYGPAAAVFPFPNSNLPELAVDARYRTVCPRKEGTMGADLRIAFRHSTTKLSALQQKGFIIYNTEKCNGYFLKSAQSFFPL